MGLLDIFKFGKVIAHTAKAVKQQRNVAGEWRALPMPELVAKSLAGLHSPHTEWKGTARPPRPDARAVATAKRLPEELIAFYEHCDGLETTEEFPVRLLSLGELRLGADHQPPLSKLVQDFWKEHGNDGDKAGLLAVLPPDDLAALATNAAESHLRPQALDMMVPIAPSTPNLFVAVVLTSANDKLPAGSVLDFENGAATRYDDFKHWLATRGSLFASLQA